MPASTVSEKFNFKTGHFKVYYDKPQALQPHRKEVQEIVQFAQDKTLPNSKEDYLARALPYEARDKPKHPVEAEIPRKFKP